MTNPRVIQVSGVVNKTAVDSSSRRNQRRRAQAVLWCSGERSGLGPRAGPTASESGISDFHMLTPGD